MTRTPRFAVALALALTLAVSGTTEAASAAPKNTPVVTKPEFAKTKKGMVIKTVHSIFGTKGKQTSFDSGYPGPYGWPAHQTREYKTKSPYGAVIAGFDKIDGVWVLVSKTAFWG